MFCGWVIMLSVLCRHHRQQPPQPEGEVFREYVFKSKKEAIEAFKVLLREKVKRSISNTTKMFYNCCLLTDIHR